MNEVQAERLVQALERLASALEKYLAKPAAGDKSIFEHVFGK